MALLLNCSLLTYTLLAYGLGIGLLVLGSSICWGHCCCSTG